MVQVTLHPNAVNLARRFSAMNENDMSSECCCELVLAVRESCSIYRGSHPWQNLFSMTLQTRCSVGAGPFPRSQVDIVRRKTNQSLLCYFHLLFSSAHRLR